MCQGSICPWRGPLPLLHVRTWIEPVVASTQVATSLYDAGLLLVVKASFGVGPSSNHSSSPSPRGALEDEQQRAISNFYIVYHLVMGLTPLLSAYGLGWLSDRYHRKVAICVPLLGFLLSRLVLLLKVLLDWPVEMLYAGAALTGLCGGFSAFWSGVMALGSLSSSEGRRSLRLIVIDLILGLAGFWALQAGPGADRLQCKLCHLCPFVQPVCAEGPRVQGQAPQGRGYSAWHRRQV